ncbi:MAG: hypothetical protein ABIO45_06625 [Burkholderiaceae bacterium]
MLRLPRNGRAVGSDWKGKRSPVSYRAAIAPTAWRPWIAQELHVVAALIWIGPDKRIEHAPARRP